MGAMRKNSQKHNFMRRLLALLLAGSILVTAVSGVDNDDNKDTESGGAVVADNANTANSSRSSRNPGDGSRPEDWPIFREILEQVSEEQAGLMAGSLRSDVYQYYYNDHKDKPRPNHEIVVKLSDYVAVRNNAELGLAPDYRVGGLTGLGGELSGAGELLIWRNDVGVFDYEFDVPESGIYHLEFHYQPIEGRNNSIELALRINDEHPFAATRNLELPKYWQNEGEIERDRRDNEMLPRQVQLETDIRIPLKDNEGLFNEPYFFYLEKGRNKLTLDGIKVNGVGFSSVTFKNYPALKPYVAPSSEAIRNTPPLKAFQKNAIDSYTILLQGQTPFWRSTTELIPTYDNGTYLVEPSDARKIRYNTIGGEGSWSRPGQAATWSFEVPASGYYRISAKVRQNMLRGFAANRRVLINGEVPFEEFNAVKFPYSSKWYQQSFTTDTMDKKAEDAYVYLEKGTNTITLECVPGDIGEVMQRLSGDLFILNYYYRRILMIVGPSPDEFNPYHVEKQIPELLDVLAEMRDRLREEKANVEKYTTGGSEASTLETLAVIIQKCIDRPHRIPMRMVSLGDNISALSAWIRESVRQPLEIDYIEIMTVHETPGSAKPNFFKQLWFMWRGFIGSFFEDYTKLGDEGGLNVWVGLGRDQAMTLKQLVDGDYNENNTFNNHVSINLVQGSIMEAALAGKGPEIALFIGGDFPVQLAARNMIVNLKQFEDYQEIVDSRFVSTLPTFFTYLDGMYGLPLTQVFPMMFYRTDILQDLEIDPPTTWDEFIDSIAILNRAFLEIGLASPTGNLTSTIFEPGDTFALLMLQTGNNFYVEGVEGVVDHSRTMFDEESSIDAFTRWTEFYTTYQFRQTFDAFSRFRTGEMPIVIQAYTFFNQLSAAAPEIRGSWTFRHVPGTVRVDDDGEEFLDISASSAATAGIIFNSAPNKEAAWDFLCWLTSDEIQTQFGQNMEAMLGPLGRYDTANKNALANLAWSAGQLSRLEFQRDAIVEIPMIPANYSATRHIKNAFRAVVNDNYPARFAINSYNRDINAEITRKNSELRAHNYR